jgi:trimeric autotransporter adhesin
MSISSKLNLGILCFLMLSSNIVLAEEQPQLIVTPAALDFKNQPVKETSAEKTLTLKNSGQAELKSLRLDLAGDHKSDFAKLDTSTCGNTLAAGESCQINFTFTPKAEGSRWATLTVSSNAPSGPTEIVLKGTGIILQPALKLSPTALDFKNQPVKETSAEKSLTLKNSGQAELSSLRITLAGEHKSDFALADTSTCGNTLAAGESCQINFTFTPKAEGSRWATLTVSSNAPSGPTEIVLKGTGIILQPALKLSPTALDFKNQPVKETSAEKSLTLKNSGQAELSSLRITLAGEHKSDFALADTSTCEKTLAAGESCKINLIFTPKAEGARSATLTVTSNADSSPDEIVLKGTGIILRPAVKLSPTALDFKDIAVKETSAEKSLTLKNTGKAELSNIRLKIDGPHNSDFAQIDTSTCEKTLAAGESCKINLTFTPKAEGAREATLTLTSNAASSPDEILLKGTGVIYKPVVELTPATLDFKTQTVNETSREQTLTLKNTGQAELSNIRVKIDGDHKSDFYILNSSTCEETLAVSANCKIKITFTPKAAEARQATLSITSTALSSPDEIILKGTGVEDKEPDTTPKAQLKPTSLDFGNHALNASSDIQTVTLKNGGAGDLRNLSFTIEGANKDEFGTPLSTCKTTLAARDECTIDIIFTPTAAGVREATLTVISNATSSPDTVTLTGTGVPDDQPIVRLMPASLSFKRQTVFEASAEEIVTLTNEGQVELTNIDITVDGDHFDDFALASSTCGETLLAGETCDINLSFTPKAEGTREASLIVASNAMSSPDTVTLQGVGKAPAIPYPSLGNAIATDAEGNLIETPVKFFGGVAVVDENGELNGGEFQTALDVNPSQAFIVNGVISGIPRQQVDQQADTLVVGLYVVETDQEGNLILNNDSASAENCDSTLFSKAGIGSGFYIKIRNETVCDDFFEEDIEIGDDFFEEGAEEVCVPGVEEYFESWDGNPLGLEAYETVFLPNTVMLTDENDRVIYKGPFGGTGHICVYFGYRLPDGTLVYNGEQPINIRIRE